MNTREIGTRYEKEAAEFLEKKGYKILEMNFRGRNAEADIISLAWIFLHHLKGGCEPTFVLERRSFGEHLDGIIYISFGSACQPCTEVSCFHSARTATAKHDKAFFCESLAEEHHFLIHRVGAQEGVTTHDADAEA